MNKDVLSSCIIDHRGKREVRIYRDSALKLFDWSEEQRKILKDSFEDPGHRVLSVPIKEGETVDDFRLLSRVEYALASILIERYLKEIRLMYDGLFWYALAMKYGINDLERIYHNISYRVEDNLYDDPNEA